jgi:transcriptional regulator with GAF, ATPase, and Fis domain
LSASRVTTQDDGYTAVVQLIAAQPVLVTDVNDIGGLLRRLCSAAAAALAASGVGLSVLAQDGQRAISTGSDAASEKLEDLQFLFGEGPCIDALAARRPVLVAHLDEAAFCRWPGYAPAAHEGGIRAVFAFPLQVGAARLGALDVFRTDPGSLSAAELRQALLFAEVAVSTLLDGQADATDGTVGGLADQIAHSAALFQAQGMVMAQLDVTLAEALTRIRAYTFAENLTLHDVAAEIVGGTLHLGRDQP